MGLLDGKVAFITGVARGQGRSHALAVAEQGADIIGIDACAEVAPVPYEAATEEDLAETRTMVEATGRRIVATVGDVRDQAVLDRTLAEGVERFGRLDVAVANAGVCAYGRFWEVPDDHWHSIIDTNLTGVWRTFRAAARIMVEQGYGGSLIAISSTAGRKGLPGLAAYTASKHGVVGLVRSAAIELGPYDIRVNSIHPGNVATKMGGGPPMEKLLAENPSYQMSFHTLLTAPEQQSPADISAAVVYLASDAARCITGTQLAVDRGATAY